ncbi:MAG: NAD(P)/FAD-dependent oxidoreductase [Acidobacteriota bacterium]|nr:NAD(P)/FAD-dependent oxidoreductase [Acidobacteriota bacterium]
MGSYETIVVGGGPAGLTAGIHLGWHDRRVLVIDRRSGPLFFTLTNLWNVPGQPEVRGIDLQGRLRAQAEALGVEIIRANVISVSGEEGDFVLAGEKGQEWHARTLLLATGVARYHPTVDGDYRPCFKYAGKGNLFYCPDCEAPEIRGKSTLVIGAGTANAAAGMAIGLSRYGDDIRVLLTGDRELSDERRARLSAKEIAVVEGEISELVGDRQKLQAVKLKDGTLLEAEAFFVSSPAKGRTDLAEQLGVEIASTGTHAQPRSQRGDTNVPGVWVAGDLRPMTQQVAVAMGTGNIAAVMIDQHLRRADVAGP